MYYFTVTALKRGSGIVLLSECLEKVDNFQGIACVWKKINQ